MDAAAAAATAMLSREKNKQLLNRSTIKFQLNVLSRIVLRIGTRKKTTTTWRKRTIDRYTQLIAEPVCMGYELAHIHTLSLSPSFTRSLAHSISLPVSQTSTKVCVRIQPYTCIVNELKSPSVHINWIKLCFGIALRRVGDFTIIFIHHHMRVLSSIVICIAVCESRRGRHRRYIRFLVLYSFSQLRVHSQYVWISNIDWVLRSCHKHHFFSSSHEWNRWNKYNCKWCQADSANDRVAASTGTGTLIRSSHHWIN